MSVRTARQIQLVSRPAGMSAQEHFKLAEVALPTPGEGQALAENRCLSVDPHMRGRMRAEGVYAALRARGAASDSGETRKNSKQQVKNL